MSPREAYRAAVAALAAPLQERLAARDRAQQELVGGRRSLRDRMAASAASVRQAQAGVTEARRAAERTETHAESLWRDLARFTGERDLIPLPPAGAIDPRDESAERLLGRADRMFAAARRGELPLAPPVPIVAATLIAGVVGAAALAGAALALSSAGAQMHGTEHTVTTVAAIVARYAAPLGGLPLALAWLGRYGQPLTGRALLVLLGAGVVVGYGLAVFG